MDKVNIIIVLFFFIVIFGCHRDGCTDINGENFDVKANTSSGLCTYRYLNSVTIIKVPEKNPDESTISIYPNLKFYMKKEKELYWEVETTVAFENWVYPYMWDINISSDNYLYWEETYKFFLSDEKYLGRDTIFTGTFIPSQLYKNDKITLNNEDLTGEIELSFVIF